MQTPKKTAIVGSGLVGSLLAIYLRHRGHEVDIFDRRPDIRTIKFSGRSINLAMSLRGWQALEEVGIADEVKKVAVRMDKRAIHMPGKPLYFQYYGKEGEAIYSISRDVLNKKMIDLAEATGARFIFESKVWDVDLPEATIHIGQAQREARKYDLVFGADGAFSRVRHKMQRQSRFNYSQEFLDSGYKELTIPPNPDGSHKLDKHSLHIWPRGAFMLIALPNLDGSFTCTLFMPFEGKNSFEMLDTESKVQEFFEHYFPDVVEDIPSLLKEFFKNPTSALVTIKCFPWTYWDKVALIGDSAHAIVPFYGQGMNAGFEDIQVLNNLMNVHEDDWETIFKQYQAERKPNADAIAELSFRNFMEMSTKTADKRFILRKKIESRFAEKHPDKWVPLYSRVTFSDRPYAEALAEGDRQRIIMDKVMQMDNIAEIWDSGEVEQEILSLLNLVPSKVAR
ncbi:FAD-dependent oxidoreductase [Sinomicrobium weinanense]|uniref:Kynurenine 3-monooxygenase n=1 Tax=Sinomicrobium weinanense TaxID=2842200 RepID=A0A926Q2K9_9FLAO|nr:NAD(P)/FAD-dependent oxidoreductase [Sinomicrobium weinanense]MBC9795954.1 FAD-dependent monooxygenase [Sinomicrobium weinanense]MBU3122073.1 FAD-dependent monooxygenase [Sinomicrobium weinanense]